MAEFGIEPIPAMQTYRCLIARQGEAISPQRPIGQPFAD